MREAVGSTFLFKLMIIFIFFFASFLAIAINYSQAFRIKNSVINKLEQLEGYNENSEVEISQVITNNGYYRNVDCSSREEGGVSPENTKGVCIKGLRTGTNDEDIYYQVTTYISFNLPIVGNLFTFPVKGETKVITKPADDTDWDLY